MVVKYFKTQVDTGTWVSYKPQREMSTSERPRTNRESELQCTARREVLKWDEKMVQEAKTKSSGSFLRVQSTRGMTMVIIARPRFA